MGTVRVKDLIIGEGRPKICVPMVGRTVKELQEEANKLKNCKADIIEWRVDFFEDVESLEKVMTIAQELRHILIDYPILFTFRTKEEGGEIELPKSYYMKLNKMILSSGLFELNDIELFIGDMNVEELVNTAHQNNVKAVLCNHDFDKTPSKEEILKRLKKMQSLNADICKMAVMPKSSEDVLVLLQATSDMKANFADRPIVTMSMGELGMISRVSGGTFGSAITFGSLEKVSAPGQIEISKLKTILETLYNNK